METLTGFAGGSIWAAALIAALAALVAALVGRALLGRRSEPRPRRSARAALAPVGLAALSLALGVLVGASASGAAGSADYRLLAVVAGALAGALTLLFNLWRERAFAAASRAEKTRDLERALGAEIYAHLSRLTAVDLEAHRDAVVGRMREDPGFVPFVPRERNDRVFEALTAEIWVLETRVVAPVTFYYNVIDAVALMAEDLRSPAYKRMAPERRIAMFSDFIEMKREAAARAREALASLGPEWAEAADGSVARIRPGAPGHGGHGH